MLLYDGRHYPESFMAYKKSGELDPSDENLFISLAWMGLLKDVSGDRPGAVSFYREALKHDTGGYMRHDQYGLRIDKAWVEERIKTPYRRDK